MTGGSGTVSRRDLLVAGALAGSLAGAATPAAATPAGAAAAANAVPRAAAAACAPREGARPKFVLVHGAWHGASCWSRVADRLRSNGFDARAIDLPGHGLDARYPASYFAPSQAGFDQERSPLGDVTLESAAQAVIAALAQAQGAVKPVLVGHSLGGSVITRAAEIAPELIGRLVYLSAFLPTRHASPAALYALPEARTPYDAPLTVGDSQKIGAVRFNPRGDLGYLRLLQSVFYQDVSEAQFLPRVGAMSPDLPLRLWTDEPRASASRWGGLKRAYIHCSLDRAIAPALQRLMVADADRVTPDNRTQVMALASSHSPFASQVEPLVALLRGLAVGAVTADAGSGTQLRSAVDRGRSPA